MSRLVNLSDKVYEELTMLKKARDASYSQVIERLLHSQKGAEKTTSWSTMIAKAKERDSNFKGKKQVIDHDLVAYGVSRDSS